jgi:predicted PurR-regulated permease PerM
LAGATLGAILALMIAILRRMPAPRPHLPHSRATEAQGSPADGAALATPGGAHRGPGRWPAATKYVVGVLLALALLALLYAVRSVLPILILAALIAFVVSPLVRLFERLLRGRRVLAVAFTYLLVVAALILLPVILVPMIIKAVNDLIAIDYVAIVEQATAALAPLAAQARATPIASEVLAPILDSILATLQAATVVPHPEEVSVSVTLAEASERLARTLGLLTQVLGPVVSAVASLVFMVLIALYISLTGHQVKDWLRPLIPPGYEAEITGLLQQVSRIWSAFVGGQLAMMILIGVVVWLGNLALGNANALLLGVISGLMELIPNIGPAIALVPGVLMALLFGSSHFAISPILFALIVLAFYLLVQVLENQVVVPKLMGDMVDLPPLVVIIGVFVGGATVGILGVFLAAPVIATGREVFLYFYNKIVEPPPAPPEEERRSILENLRGLLARIPRPSRPRLRRNTPQAARAQSGAATARSRSAENPAPALAGRTEAPTPATMPVSGPGSGGGKPAP